MTPIVKAKRKFPRNEVVPVALELAIFLIPYCKHVAIAGSVRRMVPMVGDIELLCICDLEENQNVLSGEDCPGTRELLGDGIAELERTGVLAKRLNVNGHTTFGPLNKLMVHLPTGIPVDIFSTTSENWGMSLMVRTGSKEWNIRMMARFKALGMKGHAYGGVTDVHGREISCPTEEGVFKLLKWNPVFPEARS